jgi:hypothetical protein
MSEPIDVELVKGRMRAEDARRLAAREVTPEELQHQNSFIRPEDIVYVDFSFRGSPETWEKMLKLIEQS